jgi:cytidylate kinase
MNLPVIITIDGPAASGKSTIAEILANRLGYLFFDTGVMYRAVTWAALQQLGSPSDEDAVSVLAKQVVIDVMPPSQKDGRMCDVVLDGVDITWQTRRADVEAHVSQVSAYAGVRQAMTEQQRRIGRRGKVIMVGRDIGTVVLPNAELKIYLDASVEERARRRYEELLKRGEPASFEAILAGLRRRDEIDSTRAVAPLRPAEDAVIIGTDGLSIEQVVARVMALLETH